MTVRGSGLLAGALLAASFAACASTPGAAPPLRPVASNELRSPADFDGIRDRDERSQALFMEATRVLFHPRCINCHPAGESPTQGDRLERHDPPVFRGPDDHGVVGLECTSCHQDRNVELARVPGAPKWALAPIEMAWQNRSAHDVCEQIKDKKRNDDKSLAQITDHMANDPLVAWGWDPGHGRTPAPGTQKQLGALIAAWVETGAACPPEEKK
jgi:hypothetical protein